MSATTDHYSSPDPTVDPNIERGDRRYSLGAGSTLDINRDWSVSLEDSASNVTSNIRNFVRDNLSMSLSATQYKYVHRPPLSVYGVQSYTLSLRSTVACD